MQIAKPAAGQTYANFVHRYLSDNAVELINRPLNQLSDTELTELAQLRRNADRVWRSVTECSARGLARYGCLDLLDDILSLAPQTTEDVVELDAVEVGLSDLLDADQYAIKPVN